MGWLLPLLVATLPKSVVLQAEPGVHSTTHRGDWEPSDTLVVAYEAYWEEAITEIANAAAAEDVTVRVLVRPETDGRARVWRTTVRGRIGLVPVAIDTPWVRDYGPLQLRGPGGPLLLDTAYTAERPKDDAFARGFAALMQVPLKPMNVTLDGGALISNGDGLCAMTRSSLDEMGLSIWDVEGHDTLLRELGCAVMAVLPPLEDEPTGHVDMFAQFVSATSVVVAWVDAATWPEDHARLEESVRGLQQAAKGLGIQLDVNRVAMPRPEYDLYLSYVNGVRVGQSFLVPSYSDVERELEAVAHMQLAQAMPGVRIVPIDSDRMIEQEGAIHCITQTYALASKSSVSAAVQVKSAAPRPSPLWGW